MRRLMLLRHAKTEHDAPSGRDHDRRLDERGRLDAAAIGTWVARHPPLPDAVHPAAQAAMALALLLTVVTGLDYVIQAIRLREGSERTKRKRAARRAAAAAAKAAATKAAAAARPSPAPGKGPVR